MVIRVTFGNDMEEKVLKTIKIPFGSAKPKKIDEKKPSGIVLEWERQLGFKNDPFKPEIIRPISETIAGLEKEREILNVFIVENGRFAVITGAKNSGKTTLLKWLEAQLGQFKREMVVNCIESSELKADKLSNALLRPFGISSAAEPFEKIVKQKLGERRYILLVDNVDELSKETIAALNKLFSSFKLHVITAGGKEPEIPKAEEGKASYIADCLKIPLKDMPFSAAKEMLQKRIEIAGGKGIYPFDEELLKSIWNEAGKSPIKFMELCRKQAISYAIKKSKGANIEDTRSYEKDGIDVNEIKSPEQKIEAAANEDAKEDAKKENTYKIEVIDRSSPAIIIEDAAKKGEEQKYRIQKVKNEGIRNSKDARGRNRPRDSRRRG